MSRCLQECNSTWRGQADDRRKEREQQQTEGPHRTDLYYIYVDSNVTACTCTTMPWNLHAFTLMCIDISTKHTEVKCILQTEIIALSIENVQCSYLHLCYFQCEFEIFAFMLFSMRIWNICMYVIFNANLYYIWWNLCIYVMFSMRISNLCILLFSMHHGQSLAIFNLHIMPASSCLKQTHTMPLYLHENDDPRGHNHPRTGRGRTTTDEAHRMEHSTRHNNIIRTYRHWYEHRWVQICSPVGMQNS